MRSTAFTLVRAITYSALFIGFLLIFLPAQVLEWSGLVRPAQVGAVQIADMLVGGFGAVVAVWCILTFSTIGRGTPAGLFLLVMHLFVALYEESALQETFGPEYARYCARVQRWWPGAGRS